MLTGDLLAVTVAETWSYHWLLSHSLSFWHCTTHTMKNSPIVSELKEGYAIVYGLVPLLKDYQ